MTFRWIAAFGLLASIFTFPAQAQPIGSAIAVIPSASNESAGLVSTMVTGASIALDDRVRTDTGGRANLQFLDETRLDVGPNSSLVLDRFVYNPDRTARRMSMELARGVFRFVTGLSPKRAYQIRTPTATIGVRGTDLLISVTEGLTTVQVLDGAIEACNKTSRRCAVVDPLKREPNAVLLWQDGRIELAKQDDPPSGSDPLIRRADLGGRDVKLAAARDVALGIVTAGVSQIGPISPGLPLPSATSLDPNRPPVIKTSPNQGVNVTVQVIQQNAAGEVVGRTQRSIVIPASQGPVNLTTAAQSIVRAFPTLTDTPGFQDATVVVQTPYGSSRTLSATQILRAQPPITTSTATIPGLQAGIDRITVRVPVQ